MTEFSRRQLIQSAASAAMVGTPEIRWIDAMVSSESFLSLLRAPDLVRAFGPQAHEIKLSTIGGSNGSGGTAAVAIAVKTDHVAVSLLGSGVTHLQLRWRGDLRAVRAYVGDHWERSYGDLEWRGEAPNRPMPWYFLTFDGKSAHGYGVRTGAGAMCFWTADAEGISLWADLRSGGVPVELGDRVLCVAEVVCRQGRAGETPFAFAQSFCRQMCASPMPTDQPVYGTNDWNYAYGNNSAELISGVSELISELSPDSENRPYSVIDEGWAMGPFNGKFGHGPWEGNPRFGDMGAFAHKLKAIGVRPGIWFRPLTPLPDSPESWKLSRDPAYLDPTIPEVHEHVAKEMRKLVGWGYEMVKHDFTTRDYLGMWGFETVCPHRWKLIGKTTEFAWMGESGAWPFPD